MRETSALSSKKYHTNHENQCLHKLSDSHWAPGVGLFYFVFFWQLSRSCSLSATKIPKDEVACKNSHQLSLLLVAI